VGVIRFGDDQNGMVINGDGMSITWLGKAAKNAGDAFRAMGCKINESGGKMKMKTFEEWMKEPYPCGGPGWQTVDKMRLAWDDARLGMVPADSVIMVPDWSSAPDGVTSIKLFWSPQLPPNNECFMTIPRPTTAYTPKVYDKVFYRHTGDCVGVDVIAKIINEYDGLKCKRTTYWMSGTPKDGWFEVKPFNPAYIGKPWSEIPN
jgi:hypothetical protein